MNFNNKEREMSEQKFKVVKCLKHIPEKLWGKVFEDDVISSSYQNEIDHIEEYRFKPTDTFPLPEQGTEVEMSMNGLFNGYDGRNEAFIAYYNGEFVTEFEGCYDSWRYIRPIEVKEERSEFRELAERLDMVYKIVYKYVNGTNPPKTDKS